LSSDEAVGLLLAMAYPDRVARRRGSEDRFLLANGRGARLARGGGDLARHSLIVAASLEGGTGEAVIHLAAPIGEQTLRKQLTSRLTVRDEVRWEPREGQGGAVVAWREECFGEIVLARRPLSAPSDLALRAAILDGVRQLGVGALPWEDATREWQARVGALRGWLPDDGWPDVSDERLAATLDAWLAPWLHGVTRREHLARLDLAAALDALLDPRARRRLAEGAPTHVRVPSGASRRLAYAPGRPPVLAVKLQEMFGLADGPRVAWGRVPVTLELLSPAGRPLQVTQDLRSFWAHTYPEIRKELRGRYPRHPWPEDPWTAPPTARTKRR
jgi:ATP-dependent helicase HrpB